MMERCAVGTGAFQAQMRPLLDRVPNIFDAVAFEQGENDAVKMDFTRGSNRFSFELIGIVDQSSIDLYVPKADYALCRKAGTVYPTPEPMGVG